MGSRFISMTTSPIHDRIYSSKMSSNPQAENVIKNIIREICFECNAQGQSVSETLAAFMVGESVCVCVRVTFRIKLLCFR